MSDKIRIGKAAEELVASYLLRHGYKIVDKNVYYREGELDIVAQKQGIYCFVEVKARRGCKDVRPEEAMTHTKQKHWYLAIEHYLYDNAHIVVWRADLALLCWRGGNDKAQLVYAQNFEFDEQVIASL
ncbi:MAG: YraN family protein [Candidatus Komeilibacteria bacterium]